MNKELSNKGTRATKKGFFLKSLLIVIVIIVAISTVSFVFYWQYTKFPTPKNPVSKKYEWQFKGKAYVLEETLYQSTDKYYQKKPKGIFSNFEEISLSKYLKTPTKDNTVDDIAQKLQDIAARSNLTADQTVDLAVSYVQSLPYDEARARTDLTHPRYPYETLYEKTGICSDKSLLTVSILRKMGYGASIFMYEKDQHMAPAVQCSPQYSNYNSGYCIAETTAVGHKIGIIPELDQGNLQAVQRSEIQNFKSDNASSRQNKILSDPEIYAKTQGKTYGGVLQTLTNEKEVEQLSNYFETQKLVIEQKENELDSMTAELDRFKARKDYSSYNRLVPSYNNLVVTIRNLIDEYNTKVARYNLLIKE